MVIQMKQNFILLRQNNINNNMDVNNLYMDVEYEDVCVYNGALNVFYNMS